MCRPDAASQYFFHLFRHDPKVSAFINDVVIANQVWLGLSNLVRHVPSSKNRILWWMGDYPPPKRFCDLRNLYIHSDAIAVVKCMSVLKTIKVSKNLFTLFGVHAIPRASHTDVHNYRISLVFIPESWVAERILKWWDASDSNRDRAD